MKNKGGRPSKIDAEVTQTIANLLRCGAMVDAACAAAGIDRATFYRWMKAAEDGNVAYSGFRDQIKRALADCENSLVAGIRLAGKTNWTALAWLLERRFPSRWAKNLTVAPPPRGETPLPVVRRKDGDAGV